VKLARKPELRAAPVSGSPSGRQSKPVGRLQLFAARNSKSAQTRSGHKASETKAASWAGSERGEIA